MPDLIAQGPSSENRWRRELPNFTMGTEVVIGRTGADWNVPWDGIFGGFSGGEGMVNFA